MIHPSIADSGTPALASTAEESLPRRPADGSTFVLENVSWELYELLLRDIGDRPVRATYDDSTLVLQPANESGFLLEGASWELYELMVRDIDGKNTRVTYDNGRMSLMSPPPIHDIVKTVTGFLLELTALELDLPCRRFGSTTWKREDLGKGLEPDECYYLSSAHLIGNRTDIDLNRDPPPDLAIEVEITHHPIGRVSIYAALGVAELWRYDGHQFRFFRRGKDGQYAPIDVSIELPMLSADVINQHLTMLPTEGEQKLIRKFRDWLRTLPEAK